MISKIKLSVENLTFLNSVASSYGFSTLYIVYFSYTYFHVETTF